ncbi:MAG: SsrA-binding protein SmpB [Patescibacteria group bacterium]
MESKTNKKAFFNYEILEKFQAGLKLLGLEVKSVQNNRYSLLGAYVSMRGGEAWLINADIAPYQPKNIRFAYDPQRPRKLLLTKKELKYLLGKNQEKGLTIVPLRVYNTRGQIKLEIALAKGKSKADKREVLKKRSAEREVRQTLREKTASF